MFGLPFVVILEIIIILALTLALLMIVMILLVLQLLIVFCAEGYHFSESVYRRAAIRSCFVVSA